jgi:hypothetical protein
VAGAVPERSLRQMLADAGFAQVGALAWTGYRTSSLTQGASCRALRGS